MIPHGIWNVVETAEQVVPPNPTKRDLVWGSAYPCLQYAPLTTGQCGGMMQPDLVATFEGREWQHFTCDRCGRQADDYLEEDNARTSTA